MVHARTAWLLLRYETCLFSFSLVLKFPEAVKMLREAGVEMADNEDLRWIWYTLLKKH